MNSMIGHTNHANNIGYFVVALPHTFYAMCKNVLWNIELEDEPIKVVSL